jgi:hypothetical protein
MPYALASGWLWQNRFGELGKLEERPDWPAYKP